MSRSRGDLNGDPDAGVLSKCGSAGRASVYDNDRALPRRLEPPRRDDRDEDGTDDVAGDTGDDGDRSGSGSTSIPSSFVSYVEDLLLSLDLIFLRPAPLDKDGETCSIMSVTSTLLLFELEPDGDASSSSSASASSSQSASPSGPSPLSWSGSPIS